MQACPFLLKLRRSAQLYSESVVGIIHCEVHSRTALHEIPVEEGVEHILRVLLRVAYLSVVRTVDGVRHDVEAYRVEAYVGNGKCVKLQSAVHSHVRRDVHIHIDTLECISAIVHEAAEDVLLSCLHPYLRHRQTFAQCHVVYALLAELCGESLAEACPAVYQAFVASAGVHLQIEVAAIDERARRVAVCQNVKRDIHRTVAPCGIENRHVARPAAQHIHLLHVGGNVEMAAQRTHERFLRDAQCIQVHAVHVGRECGVNLLAVDESVEREESVDELVPAVHRGVYHSVLQSGVHIDVRQMVFVVDELAYLCPCIHSHAL